MKQAKLSLFVILLFIIIVTAGCSMIKQSGSSVHQNIPSRIWDMLPYLSSSFADSDHIILVSNTDQQSYAVKLYVFEKQNGKWHLVFDPFDAVIGINGFAVPKGKKEGDKKTPTGIYPLMRVFGYGQAPPTRMPYIQLTDEDIWIDDVNSDNYNKLVKKGRSFAASYEKMKRDDNLYKYGIVVEYNTNPVIKGDGSAIFFHVWGGPNVPTSGCIAMPEDNILKLIEWLDPSRKPMAVMGTEDALESLMKSN